MSRRRILPIIENHTQLRGDDLRRLVMAAIKAKGAAGKVLHVEFVMSRNFQQRGWAWIDVENEDHNGRIQIQIAKGFSGLPWEIIETAQLLDHEISHQLGQDHHEMPQWWEVDVDWCRGILMRHRAGHVPHRIEMKLRALFEELAREGLYGDNSRDVEDDDVALVSA